MQFTSRLALVAAFSFVVAPMGFASAGTCDTAGSPALGYVEVSATGEPYTTFYVVQPNPTSVSIWQESNGIFVGGNVLEDLQDGCRSGTLLTDTQVA